MNFLPSLDELKSKMINPSRGKDVQAKQEGEINEIRLSKTTTASTSRQWAGFKNPRIVRVSRAFGGKDRHSKVCTIRGLRDRRIRLSVPSAIQLYDLQDRLGLNQPSKVVDWLLDATKHDIDKLPPLQMPPGDFSQFYHHQKTLLPHDLNAPQSSVYNASSRFLMKDEGFQLYSKQGLKIHDNDGDDQTMAASKSKYWATSSGNSRGKRKEIERENISENRWNTTTNEQENESGNNGGSYNIPQVSAQNFFPLANQLPFSDSLLNNSLAYNWDPSNLSLSQFGNQGFPNPSQADSHNSSHSSLLPSSLALPTTSQLFFCPPATTPSFFPQYPPYVTPSVENDSRNVNHYQFLTTGSQNILPNSLVSPLHFISPFNANHPKANVQSNNDTTK